MNKTKTGEWDMTKKLSLMVAALMLALMACSMVSINTSTVVGSGKVTSQTRSATGFSSVVLKGSANVTITLGPSESIVVEGDDNILPLIETDVQNDQLVINTRPNTHLTTSNPVRVTVTVKTLKGVTLSGSGNMDVSGLEGGRLLFELPGSGNITVNGTADSVNVSLPGSGNIYCDGLKAKSASVTLNGSGNIKVYASDSLDASIRGSGEIRYAGDPVTVNKSVTGSGSIMP
jgi:hypothetical protein